MTMALLGAVQTLALVQTWAWPLPMATAALLVWRLDSASPGRAAVLAWSYGTGWLMAAVWWLFISLHRYGGLPAPVAAAAVLALAAALSLYLAAAGALYARWRRGDGSDALLWAALWLLAELARGVLFTGFPWGAAGYTQVDSPLALLAPWLGVYGIGAVLAALAVAALRLAQSRGRQWHGLVAVAVLMGATTLAPRDFTQPAGEIDVALVQTNVAQDEKFAADAMPETLAWVAQALLSARADVVVAPETAVPLLPFQLRDLAPGYWETVATHFAVPGRAALIGVPLGDFERGYTNSAIGLSAAPAYRYDKHHLVPFGEFIPTGFRWFTQMMNIPLGDFARGVLVPPPFIAGAQRLGPNICYEDLFGEELARRFADAATAPTVLVNISNIAWFGDSIAIRQHLNISRLRSLELQRPMLRSTNTGATAIVDHRGAVAALLPPHTRGVLQGRVQGREGTTPFAAWAGRAGLWPLLGAALLTLMLLWLHTRRAGRA
ncbi:MAG: apolipoprotein N-acyltransferase [Rubrivivax sp.]|nr:apolipoprotein N-acyltransferase [Rubrivivax sp.]